MPNLVRREEFSTEWGGVRTLLLAGHETTSTALSWGLLELAKQPAVQKKLRDEIHAMEATIRSQGHTGFSADDLELMPYTQAVVKEILRFHPPVYHTHRSASKDLAVPLSKPIISKTGKTIHEILVPKDTRLILSLAAYNR